MLTAPESCPQSCRVAMWPPHARTAVVVPETLAAPAVNVTVIFVWLSDVPETEYALAAVIVALNVEKFPEIWRAPTAASGGIANVLGGEEQLVTPRHSFAVP